MSSLYLTAYIPVINFLPLFSGCQKAIVATLLKIAACWLARMRQTEKLWVDLNSHTQKKRHESLYIKIYYSVLVFPLN